MSVRHSTRGGKNDRGLLRYVRWGSRAGASRKSASEAPSADSYLETQRWIERSIQSCQCPATMRFLEMVSARIAHRLREIESAGSGCNRV